jgi:dTDP-4-amino-4,6-dideoxygalactose transaminase
VIPFNRPTISPRQVEYITTSFASHHLSGDGPFTRQVSDLLSSIHDGAKVLLTTSCTAALELSALLLKLSPGDEVIVPSFTFVSSANAFAMMGARIVFVDIDPETLNLDEEQVAAALSERTKAVVAVNYGGVNSVSDVLLKMVKQAGAIVIEDNAHGLFGTANGKPLGTQSAISTLSFHETKNVTCGEGGALVINNEDFVERAEVLREKGTNRSRFFRGMVDKYTWIDVGSSYLLSDINASVLLSQLEYREIIQARRASAVEAYRTNLKVWAESNVVRLQSDPAGSQSPAHLFYMLMPDLAERTRFLAFTRERGVSSTFHYLPLHSSPAGQQYGSTPFGCPNAENISDRLVRLPVFSDISQSEVAQVVDVVNEFVCQ